MTISKAPNERTTATGKALAKIAADLFADADAEPDPNAKAKLVAAANQTIRSSLLADKAAADAEVIASVTKLRTDAEHAARLEGLDS